MSTIGSLGAAGVRWIGHHRGAGETDQGRTSDRAGLGRRCTATGADADRKLDILAAIVNQATIVDDVRGRDYERRRLAAEKLIENCGKDGQAMVESLLKSQNRAVVESVLAGVYRSTSTEQSAMVLPIWPALKSSSASPDGGELCGIDPGAARGIRKRFRGWGRWCWGGQCRIRGWRGLAGWYYVKLEGAGDAVVKMILAQ